MRQNLHRIKNIWWIAQIFRPDHGIIWSALLTSPVHHVSRVKLMGTLLLPGLLNVPMRAFSLFLISIFMKFHRCFCIFNFVFGYRFNIVLISSYMSDIIKSIILPYNITVPIMYKIRIPFVIHTTE